MNIRKTLQGVRSQSTTVVGVTALFLVLAPLLLGRYYTGLFTLALVFSIGALSLDLMWGYADVLSFGHAAFFGFGAYLMAKLLMIFQVEGIGYLGILVGTIVPGVVGLVIALLMFYRGISAIYFTIITLAIAIIARQGISSLSFMGGFDGLIGIPAMQLGIPGVFMTEFTGLLFYYTTAIVVVSTLLVSKRMVQSRFGMALLAIRENQEKARALGYNVELYQSLIFGIACAVAGFAGTLYTVNSGQVTPRLLGFLISTNFVLWVLIGGRGTLVGPVIGTIFFYFVRDIISTSFSGTWQLFIGLMLIGFVLYLPNGIMGLYTEMRKAGPREFIRKLAKRPT